VSTVKPGTLTEFERAWRPKTHPEGMLRAYAYWPEDEPEIVGVSFWDSRQSCDAWRASDAEAHRRAAMAGSVLGEREAFCRVRELRVPDHYAPSATSPGRSGPSGSSADGPR
jgi:heme-degrading monooxygenase HmoA